MVSDMRIATYEEAQVLLRGNSESGGANASLGIAGLGVNGVADTGTGMTNLAAMFDRLSANLPSSAALRPAQQGVAGTDLDCSLFASGVRVQRLLGASDPRKPGDGVGPDSQAVLDVPIRCMAQMPSTVSPVISRPSLQPTSAQGADASGLSYWQILASWVRPDWEAWVALFASALALLATGLVVQARARAKPRRSAGAEVSDH